MNKPVLLLQQSIELTGSGLSKNSPETKQTVQYMRIVFRTRFAKNTGPFELIYRLGFSLCAAFFKNTSIKPDPGNLLLSNESVLNSMVDGSNYDRNVGIKRALTHSDYTEFAPRALFCFFL